jgi:hypothetical protein
VLKIGKKIVLVLQKVLLFCGAYLKASLPCFNNICLLFCSEIGNTVYQLESSCILLTRFFAFEIWAKGCNMSLLSKVYVISIFPSTANRVVMRNWCCQLLSIKIDILVGEFYTYTWDCLQWFILNDQLSTFS